MIARDAIVAEARTWLGTRWMHQASVKGVGCDCIGLLFGVAKHCGIAEAAQFEADLACHGYGREPNPGMLVDACNRYLDPIPCATLPADILVMRFAHEPQHFALLSSIDPRYIIHSYARARKVVEHGLDELWASRIMRAYRFRGVC